MSYKSGASYTGNWVKGKQQGRGKYYFTNRSFYDGEWESGKIHGRGVFVQPSGEKK
jgi:hypothetical protein